jgi:hypothetical protein
LDGAAIDEVVIELRTMLQLERCRTADVCFEGQSGHQHFPHGCDAYRSFRLEDRKPAAGVMP